MVPIESATSSLRSTGARVTQPRVQVLATLLGAERALSHHEIEGCLSGQSIDRVTVYRVLDWLVGQRLAHRISGQDRIWRFGAVTSGEAGQYAFFECVDCSRVLPLCDVLQPAMKLPRGYEMNRVQVSVTGRCDSCARVR
jgi:Fur family transcriptional regulator, ferric uptake regulator